MPTTPSYTTRSDRRERLGLLARFVSSAARGAARRPKMTIAFWFALIIACAALGTLSGTRTLSNAASGTGESARADARLSVAGLQDPAQENVLVRSNTAARTKAAVATLEARARRLPTVRSLQGPESSPELARVGGRTALVVVSLRGDPDDASGHVAPLESLVSRLSSQRPGVTFQESGGASMDNSINQIVSQDLHRAELISVPLTLLILVLAFGALVAASVPLLLGLTSVAAALGALGLVSQIAPNGSSTAPVTVLIGLAVGIDYSLFYIRRERAERLAGATAEAALEATSATVGRAILIAGLTVMIGLAGLLFTGFGVFTSMALGAILVVAIAVVGSLTVLPAALALLGDRVDRGRIWPRRRRSGGRSRRTVWQRVAGAVTGHPRAALLTSVVVLGGLAVPVLGMQTASPGDSDLPAGTPALVTEHAIDRAFPGSSDTADLVVSGRGLGSAHAIAELRALGHQGLGLTRGHGAVSVRVARDEGTALISIPMPDGSLSSLHRTVDRLRQTLEPAATRLIPHARAQLTGGDAGDVDFTQRLSSVTPVVIAFVLALAFVLLLATFRSPLLAISVIGLNLLSVGAAFGVLVAVFQHHWAQSWLGFSSDGAIVNWLPLFAFVVLFGLSMDYTVLVLERAREARRGGATAKQAAEQALSATGGTVTSAAIVMIAVFSIFATLRLLEFKQLGIGLAAAIALDATIVRAVALPAVLTLLGDRGLSPAPAGRVVRGAGWNHGARVPALATSSTHE